VSEEGEVSTPDSERALRVPHPGRGSSQRNQTEQVGMAKTHPSRQPGVVAEGTPVREQLGS